MGREQDVNFFGWQSEQRIESGAFQISNNEQRAPRVVHAQHDAVRIVVMADFIWETATFTPA